MPTNERPALIDLYNAADRLATTAALLGEFAASGLAFDRSASALDLLDELISATAWLRDAQSSAVDIARLRGATWSQVGDVLGVSRQAAQQRFPTDPTASTDLADLPC